MKFIVPMFVGALIGYITNYLAIKMLFRPHYEKRIFGIKIPFTPGLIPKEKDRIAKSVGEAVGTHLLSTDVFVDALCSNEVKEQVIEWLKLRVKMLKQSTKKVNDVFDILGNKKEDFTNKIKQSLSAYLIEMLKNNSSEILNAISQAVNLNELLSEFIKDVDTKSKVYEVINSLGNKDVYLRELIPSSLDGTIKIYIYSNKGKIAKGLLEAISKENVKDKISYSASKMVENTLGKFAAMFLSPELIGEKIISSIQGYINNEENHHDIAMIVIALYEKLTEARVNEIYISLSEESKEDISIRISNLINQYVNETMKDIDLNSIILSGMRNEVIDNLVYFTVSYMVDGFMNLELAKLLNNITDDEQNTIFNALDNVFEDFIKDKASKIIGLIDVSKLVEDRINSFDVAFGEKIILEVASKELSAITWLGALLGAIMGIISPLLQTL